MNPQESFRLATQSVTMLLPGPPPASSCSPLHGSSSRYQHLHSPGSRTVAIPAACASHRREERYSRAHSSQGWEISQPWVKRQLTSQGLSKVLLGETQQRRRRRHCQADNEVDSLEDLNLEDLDDEQLGDLFESYGEVVKEEESAPPSTSSAVDDDAESFALAVALAEVANDVKASEIQVLCVKPLVYWTSFFVIATGFSRPQVDAIGQRMRNMAEERFDRIPQGDLKPNAWTLLDFGDVVVHIFYPNERSFYNLEEFYGNASRVELPFESQSQVL